MLGFINISYHFRIMKDVIIKLLNKKKEASLIWSVILGTALLGILLMIPFVGFLVKLVVLVFGLGAISIAIREYSIKRNCCLAVWADLLKISSAFFAEVHPFTIVKLTLWALHFKPSNLVIEQFESL